MNRRRMLAALGALSSLGALSLPPRAARAAEGEAITSDGFSFLVPPGWTRIGAGPAEGTIDHIGLWVQGSYADQAFIALDVDQRPGDNLAHFALNTENTLRTRLSKVFVDARDRLQMPNGMPAMRLKVEYLAGDNGVLWQQYLWLIYDGRIGVTLAVGGHVGRIGLDEASKIASTLKVVWRGEGPPPPP
ncbi:MAG: hypothetical protein KGM44_00725 [bacterium]|nr:hypothetical protein [bacterium]